MKLFKLNALAGLALATICATASAGPSFQVSPGGGFAPFTADEILGTSSEMLDASGGPSNITGNGWVDFSSFAANGGSLPVGQTGLGTGTSFDPANSYQLYILFSFNAALTNGTIFQNGSQYALSSLTYTVYRDIDDNDSFVQANAPTVTAATVTNTGDDVKLATGTLIPGTGSAAINQSGAALNAQDSLALTTFGTAFFTQPIPFYSVAFSSYNNNGAPGDDLNNGALESINSAHGSVDFSGVPEPASVALAGLALLGLGLASQRRKRQG